MAAAHDLRHMSGERAVRTIASDGGSMNTERLVVSLAAALALACGGARPIAAMPPGIEPATPAALPHVPAPALAPDVREYVTVDTPRIVLAHVEIIDGTEAPAQADRNVTLGNGRIVAIGPGTDVTATSGTTVLDLRGHAVLPGIVAMHDHVYALGRPNMDESGDYEGPTLALEMTFSAPRLYLANGVTTLRTAGSKNPYEDLRLATFIEKGMVPGPHMDVTGPYLDDVADPSKRRPNHLTGPDDARRTVAFWADHGVTSFKAYGGITRAELKAAVDEAHSRGLKVLGHLCSVTYEEAVAAGIDSLEHGFQVDTELDPGKKPDVCSESGGDFTLEHMPPDSDGAKRLIALLVRNHVAVTSTLVSTAGSVDDPPPIRAEALSSMSPDEREGYELDRKRKSKSPNHAAEHLHREMDLERAFVAAGGLLMAGADSVGLFGSVPGFANHREIELLVDAGFSPVDAIRIATYNGAVFLGRQGRIGSIDVGKNADLLVVKGDPATRIADIENVAIVLKDGVGYDRQKLLDAVKGHYGEY
jgi:imidazolonepropionase-like amidohydrolase